MCDVKTRNINKGKDKLLFLYASYFRGSNPRQ